MQDSDAVTDSTGNRTANDSQAVHKDADAACEVCGKFGAFQFEDRTLCQECYGICGSCCCEAEE